jgi:hypothetical protein
MTRQIAVGPFATLAGRSVVAALRDDPTTFGLDGLHSLSFDRAGRLLRAFWGRRSVRRSLDNRFIEKHKVGEYAWSYARRELDSFESRRVLETTAQELTTIHDSLAGPAPHRRRPCRSWHRQADVSHASPQAGGLLR